MRADPIRETTVDDGARPGTQGHRRPREAMIDESGGDFVQLWVHARNREVEITLVEEQAVHSLAESRHRVEIRVVSR